MKVPIMYGQHYTPPGRLLFAVADNVDPKQSDKLRLLLKSLYFLLSADYASGPLCYNYHRHCTQANHLHRNQSLFKTIVGTVNWAPHLCRQSCIAMECGSPIGFLIRADDST
jgi:hypothetical protein